jgi:hypothetical protein
LPAGKVVVIRARAAGEAIAAPRPWTMRERGRGEEEHTDDEHLATSEQVAESATEEQQAADGQGVGVDDPRQAGLAEAEIGLDVGQRDVDDGAVEHDHQLGSADDGEGEPEPSTGSVGRCRGDRVLRFGGAGGISDGGHGEAFRGRRGAARA